MNVEINVPPGLLSRLQGFANGGPRQLDVLRGMGEAVKEVTREHLRDLAGSRHTTADRLGGTYTGFLAQAAQAVESAPLQVGGGEAAFVINHPGIGRAFHPITIGPGPKMLSIPLNAIAYGHRIGDFDKVQLFIKGGQRTGAEKPRTKKNDEERGVRQDIAAFVLVRSVTQQQDRTLLPSNEQWHAAAKEAAIDIISAS